MNVLPALSRERLTELFMELTRIPSRSYDERAVADRVIVALEDVGVAAHEDDIAAAIGGNAGNIWCTVQGEGALPHVALGAHLDTVEPTDTIEPVLEDGVFRNARRTILGADDKVAVTALLHATEVFCRSGVSFPTYELFFTVAEETGLVGAKHMGDVLVSPFAAVFDSCGPVGGITAKAPSQQSLYAAFRGRAAHSGVEPERGRSAIHAAAKSIAGMRLGRIDEETSANIGVIAGGVASNVVPDFCEIRGECRSHDDEKLARTAAAMVDAMQEGAAQVGVDVDISLSHEYHAYALTNQTPVVRLSKAAISALGIEPRMQIGGGGSDANIFNARGLPTVNLDAGMMQVHCADEYVTLDDLERLCSLILQLIVLAPQYGPRSRPVVPGGMHE
ncbi:MAG: M20/M25/M40 family metallo-hydrolase [Thermoleophilia bacterium]|jgi:tripeptide aminopeptidase